MISSVQVPYGLSFGVTNDTVIGLLVCWHTPAAANNTHTNGNAFNCTIMDRQTANSWTSQQCPAGEVVSDYRVDRRRWDT
jgi:hypothetical protein